MSDAAVIRFVIEEIDTEGGVALPAAAPSRRRVGLAAICCLAAAAAGALAVWQVSGRPAAAASTLRAMIVPPAHLSVGLTASNSGLALAPAGDWLAYVPEDSSSTQEIAIRAFDSLEVRTIRSSGAPRAPVVSPDGQWVAVNAQGEIQRIPVAGGPAAVVCELPGPATGLAWTSAGDIIFGAGNTTGGLFKVPAAGGQPAPITSPDFAAGESAHYAPHAVAGTNLLVYSVSTGPTMDNDYVAAVDLTSGESTVLIRNATHAKYATSGHLVYVSAGTLWAVPFDAARRRVAGSAVPLAGHVARGASRRYLYDLSPDGTIVYVPAAAAAEDLRELVWVHRDGREQPVGVPARAFTYARASPDGTRIALTTADDGADVWVWRIRDAQLTRLTFGSAVDTYPVWTPDSTRIVYSSTRSGAPNVFWQRADGTGTADQLSTGSDPKYPLAVTRDGRQIILRQDTPGGNHLAVLDVQTGSLTELLKLSPGENNADLSADGRWLAVQAHHNGPYSIDVYPFPNVAAGRWQVATVSSKPTWSRTGNDLFFLGASRTITHVKVRPDGASFAAAEPVTLIRTPYYNNVPGRTFDVAPDGQRFLVLKESHPDAAASPAIVLLKHWTTRGVATPR